jgi:hypothetical protein
LNGKTAVVGQLLPFCRYFARTHPIIQPRIQPLVDVPAGEIRKMRSGGTMADQQDEHRVESKPMNTEDRNIPSSQPGGGVYEIHVKGHLSSQWSDWLEGLQVKLLDNGEMILIGPIVDQAALMGVLNKLYCLNLTLLSVNNVNRNINMETK